MVSRESVEQLVRSAYAARERGDFDAMAEMFEDNGTFQFAGDPRFCPVARTTKGRANLREEFSKLRQFEFENQKMLSMAVDGDKAFVHWRMDVTFKPTGKRATVEVIDHATVTDGKITSFVQFTDTATVAEMVR